jgi:predicted acylesterase/phospholipase RssA
MFRQVVFAGGGHRCWWQAGFWDVVAPAIGLRPKVIAGVSAGAATACLLYANESRNALAYYREALRDNPRNAYWGNLLASDRRVFPHNAIYRRALKNLIGGDRFERLRREAPEIRVVYARIPGWLGPYSAVAVGLLAYNAEKYFKRPLHPVLGRRLGFTAEVARVQDCRSDSDLISLLIASSCTPPFTPIEYRDGRPTIDGGMVDNVPVDAVDRHGGPTLVLTTRRYPKHAPVFMRYGRLYVQPSVKVAASSWDYTSPALYEQTYDLGRRDGEAFLHGFAVTERAAALAAEAQAFSQPAGEQA